MMPYRNIYRFFCLFIASCPTLLVAQSLKFSLGYGGSMDKANFEPFNSFFTSFNTAAGANLKSPFALIPASSIVTHGVRGGLFLDDSKFHTRFFLQTRSNKSLTRGMTFASGLKNECIIEYKNNDFVFDVGYAGKNILLTGTMVGQFRVLNVEYATIYQDGSRSLSYEYDLNGYYNLNASNILLGGTVAFRFGRVLIPVQILFPTQIVPDLSEVTLLDYDVSRWRSSDFPKDYAAWSANKIPTTEAERLAKEANSINETDMLGMRVLVGVEVLLGKKHRK